MTDGLAEHAKPQRSLLEIIYPHSDTLYIPSSENTRVCISNNALEDPTIVLNMESIYDIIEKSQSEADASALRERHNQYTLLFENGGAFLSDGTIIQTPLTADGGKVPIGDFKSGWEKEDTQIRATGIRLLRRSPEYCLVSEDTMDQLLQDERESTLVYQIKQMKKLRMHY